MPLPSATSDTTEDRRRIEAHLLADGRKLLERLCGSTRLHWLYPGGPNLALLFECYQELDRQRAIGRTSARSGPSRRLLRRLLRKAARRDARERSLRLSLRHPYPRAGRAPPPTALVTRALAELDPDDRIRVEAALGWSGQPANVAADAPAPPGTPLQRFRDALASEALEDPPGVVRLHVRYIDLLRAPPPVRRRHPLARFILVRLPLQLLLVLVTLFNVAYLGAYLFFNGKPLGTFVSDRVNTLIAGDLEMGSIRWEGRLIFDLLTGTPSPVVVEDVSVWEPYKNLGHERRRLAAHAERVEASLVLHEIIPWNRLAIPSVLEIPWVLHFADVDIPMPIEFWIREYDDTNALGETVRLLGLRDAFRPIKPPDPDRKGLSFAVDQASLTQTAVDIDFLQTAQWRALSRFDSARINLRFDAVEVDAPPDTELPLQFVVESEGGEGIIDLALLDVQIPVADLRIERFEGGGANVAFGDVGFSGHALAAGSRTTFEGVLRHVFPRPLDPGPQAPRLVELSTTSADVGDLAAHLVSELDLASGTVEADGAPATAHISGYLDDPTYAVLAEGLTVDVAGEPAWIASDVTVSLMAARKPVPAAFSPRFSTGATRLVVEFDTLIGHLMTGSFQLRPLDSPGVVVMPEGDTSEPYLIAVPLDVREIDPALLVPDQPAIADVLGGTMSGSVDVAELVVANPPPAIVIGPLPETSRIERAALEVANMRLERRRGPTDDHLPSRWSIDGGITFDETGASLRLDDVLVTTDAVRLRIDGGLDDGLTRLRPTAIDLRIDDGAAFAAGFDLPSYFTELRAKLNVYGPLSAPSATGGSLVVAGVGGSPVPTDARVWMDSGTVHVRAPAAHLFEGSGEIEVDLGLIDHGRVFDDPTLRAAIDLREVALAAIAGSGWGGNIDLQIDVGDGAGGPARLSQIRAQGRASAETFIFAGTEYRNARGRFALTPEQLGVDELVLTIHRPVSPLRHRSSTVEVGRIVAAGTVGLQEDPALDLEVKAHGVPLTVVTTMLDVEAPVRGQIARGTTLSVAGTVRQPAIEGTVRLAGLWAGGVALGDGKLEVTSTDAPARGPLAPHRELRVAGELATPKWLARTGLQWTVDAVLAIGTSSGRRAADSQPPPVSAQVDVNFDHVGLPTLLGRPPADDDAALEFDGQLSGVSARVLTCPPGLPMLSDCLTSGRSEPTEQTLTIELEVDRAWVRGGAGVATSTDPCDDPLALCSTERLVASIDWPQIRLERPWKLRTGGDAPHEIELRGRVDLSEPPPRDGVTAAQMSCVPPPMRERPSAEQPSAPTAEAHGDATLSGRIALDALAPLFGDVGVTAAHGEIDASVRVRGYLQRPTITGQAAIPQGAKDGLRLELAAVPFPLEFKTLQLAVQGEWLVGRGTLDVRGETIAFGTSGAHHTGLGLTGACSGAFGVGATGIIAGRLISEVAGDTVVPVTGSGVELERLSATGRIDPFSLRTLAGRVALRSHSLQLEMQTGITSARLDGGVVDFRRCAGDCGDISDGWIALDIGGSGSAGKERLPATALRAHAGLRGSVRAWGSAFVAPDLSRAAKAKIRAQLDDLPFRGFDDRGRPVYEGELSSANLSVRGGEPLVATGAIAVDRARYVKDAVQGVEILALTDRVETVDAPPPPLIRGLQLDLQLATDRPLRLENNMATGVEAQALVHLGGTFEEPEFTGRIDVEPGGKVDIPFLTGTYEIERGRVTLLREIEDAEVDVLALREQPIYIDGQARAVQLLLEGTLSEIRPRCLVEGDTAGRLTTLRGCTEYLVLGAGDVQVSSAGAGVQRFGTGGLANARKSLQVVGHLTEVDIGNRAADAAPRLRTYIPDVRLRLGQIGPELEIATPSQWMDFDYGRATLGWDYTRGYPGFLLRQSRDLSVRLEILDPVTLEFSRQIRSYLNQRVIFDPLQQRKLELRFDFQVPTLR